MVNDLDGSIATVEQICEICSSSNWTDRTRVTDLSYHTCSNDFEFRLCVCGVWYLVNRPVSAEMARIYPESYTAFSDPRSKFVRQIRRKNFLQKLRQLSQSVEVRSFRLLDFGCGAGEFVKLARLSGVQVVYASDFTASRANELSALGIEFVLASDVSEMSPGSIDVVTMFQVVEHLQDPVNRLKEMASLLTDGGVLLLETPSPTGLDFRLFSRKCWGGWHAPRHFYIFSRKILEGMLQSAGFEIISARYIPSPYLWIESLRGWIETRTRWNPPKWLDLSSPFALILVAPLDIVCLLLRRNTSNQQIVARKKPSI